MSDGEASLHRWEEENVKPCSFCGRRDWRLLQQSRIAPEVAVCDHCVAEHAEVCGLNLGEDWDLPEE